MEGETVIAYAKPSPDTLVLLACAALNCDMEDVFASNDQGLINKTHQGIRRHVVLAALRMGAAVGHKPTEQEMATACGIDRTCICRMKCNPHSETPGMLSVADIFAATCQELGVKEHDVGSRARHPHLVWARRIVTILSRENSVASYPMIAEAMGLPNSSTVISAQQDATKTFDNPVGHPSRTVAGKDALEVIAAVRARLGLTFESQSSKQQEAAA